MFLEIRTFRLKPGTRAEFLRLTGGTASQVDEDGYEEAVVMRGFGSLAERQGPREAVLATVERYHTIVVEASEEAVRGLAAGGDEILEIRSYRLKPGTRPEFVRLMHETLPLLARHGIRVVDCGASLVDEDGHQEAYLMRAFASLAERDRQETEFYGGDDWRTGPREAVLSRIDSYHTIVLRASSETLRALAP